MRFFDLMTLDNIRTVNSFETTNEYYKYLDTAFRSQELNDISNLVKQLNEHSQEVNTDGFWDLKSHKFQKNSIYLGFQKT